MQGASNALMASLWRTDARYLEGIASFNRREWFEAHEVWESLWHADARPERAFWQGLIQAAVALEHWRRKNARGARSQWEQARARLTPFSPRHEGLDVDALIAAMATCMAPVLLDAEALFDESTAPRIELD